MGSKAGRQAPRPDILSYLFHPVLSVEINEVERKAHKESVNRFTRDNPHSLALLQTIAAQEAFRTLWATGRDLGTAGNLSISRDIDHPHASA
jgi:hypothetical protein